MHVALRALIHARRMTLNEVLNQDLRLAETVLPIDFPEGVRALLIDKDNRPNWRWATLEEVPVAEVDKVFGYRSSWK